MRFVFAIVFLVSLSGCLPKDQSTARVWFGSEISWLTQHDYEVRIGDKATRWVFGPEEVKKAPRLNGMMGTPKIETATSGELEVVIRFLGEERDTTAEISTAVPLKPDRHWVFKVTSSYELGLTTKWDGYRSFPARFPARFPAGYLVDDRIYLFWRGESISDPPIQTLWSGPEDVIPTEVFEKAEELAVARVGEGFYRENYTFDSDRSWLSYFDTFRDSVTCRTPRFRFVWDFTVPNQTGYGTWASVTLDWDWVTVHGFPDCVEEPGECEFIESSEVRRIAIERGGDESQISDPTLDWSRRCRTFVWNVWSPEEALVVDANSGAILSTTSQREPLKPSTVAPCDSSGL
jgi:hypothetical protein